MSLWLVASKTSEQPKHVTRAGHGTEQQARVPVEQLSLVSLNFNGLKLDQLRIAFGSDNLIESDGLSARVHLKMRKCRSRRSYELSSKSDRIWIITPLKASEHSLSSPKPKTTLSAGAHELERAKWAVRSKANWTWRLEYGYQNE